MALKKNVKVTVALLVVVSLIFAIVPSMVGQAQGGEVISMRTRTSKTHWLGGNRYSLDVSLGSLHYWDNDTGNWQEIDPNIEESSRTNWDWEVTRGHWTLLVRNDTTVAIGKDGHWIGFRYEGFAYLDWQSKDYAILDTRESVAPVVDGNSITWQNIFYGTDLVYTYDNDRFKEELIISQQARDWLAQHPPSSYGLNNQTTYLTGYIKVDWQNSYPAEDDDSNAINWDNDYEFTIGRINFRHPVKDEIVSALPLGYAMPWAPPDDFDSPIPLRFRFYREDGNHWLLFGARVLDLNELPAGAIVLDPAVDEQVGASDDDAYEWGGGGFDTAQVRLRVYADPATGTNAYACAGVRYQTVNVPQGAVIDDAYISAQTYHVDFDNAQMHIYGNDVDDAVDFAADADIITRVRTAANVAWDEDGLPINNWRDSPDISTVVKELVDRPAWVANNDMVILLIADDDAAEQLLFKSWDWAGNVLGPRLHIDYTPAVVAPPVISEAVHINDMVEISLLGLLIFIAVLLTCTMFITREMMLGFACTIFWAIAGAQSYTLSIAAWDVYFVIAFACLLGMTSFTALGAFGLREKRDSIADEELEEGEGSFIGDEEKVD